MSATPAPGERPQVAALLYPGVTLLDLLGPVQALSIVMDVHLCWKDREPVQSDSPAAVVPTMTFDECPADVDVLLVPGALELSHIVGDDEVLRFLADRGSRATWVTSVCSGALILGAAGLLTDHEASCHWAYHHLLPLVGATPVKARVVKDRNRITAGGVTAGIDFGLSLIAEMMGPDAAKVVQLGLEYDPQPPFDAGAPDGADISADHLAAMKAIADPYTLKLEGLLRPAAHLH